MQLLFCKFQKFGPKVSSIGNKTSKVEDSEAVPRGCALTALVRPGPLANIYIYIMEHYCGNESSMRCDRSRPLSGSAGTAACGSTLCMRGFSDSFTQRAP